MTPVTPEEGEMQEKSVGQQMDEAAKAAGEAFHRMAHALWRPGDRPCSICGGAGLWRGRS